MINIRQDALLLNLLSTQDARYLPRSDDRRSWAMLDRTLALEYVERAQKAKAIGAAPLRATQYGRKSYIDAYTSRVETLKALIMGTCCQGLGIFSEAMADVIYAICSQTDWSITSNDAVPDYTNTTIDVNACETGALLCLAKVLCENHLEVISPRITGLIANSVKSRIIDPLINWEGVNWEIEGPCQARAVAALITVSLVGEGDDRRRWLCLRRAINLLESLVKKLPDEGGFTQGLENHISAALALDDCFSLLSLATGGVVEMRDEEQFVRMAMSIADAHIDGMWFINPNGLSRSPDIDTDALFRLGVDARLNPLCELAAYLRHLKGKDYELTSDFTVPTPPIYQQIMSAFGRVDLARQSIRVEKRANIVKTDMNFLASRMDGFYAALTGCAAPGTCAPAIGDFTLFVDDEPEIMSFCSKESRKASVPTIAGVDQSPVPARDVDFGEGSGYRMLSMNIADAYSKKAGVTSWQRTVMMLRYESVVRLMDVFDLDQPANVTFRFIFINQPRVSSGSVKAGAVTMQFDPGLLVKTDKSTGETGFYCLELYVPNPVSSGNYSFVFRK